MRHLYKYSKIIKKNTPYINEIETKSAAKTLERLFLYLRQNK